MDAVDLALRRSQMGRSARGFLAAGPKPVAEQGEGYWVALSGAPSADANMALVDRDDAAVRSRVLHVVATSGAPTLLIQAGDAARTPLGEGWAPLGEMPFMASPLPDEHLRRDDRVRPAGPGDLDTVSGLAGDAFGLEREVSDVIGAIVDLRPDQGRMWLLVDGGTPVSTVLSSRVDDAVCVWCMATPARFARRGYGRALLAHVLAVAKHEGASIGLLGATPAGKPLYDATGWVSLEGWQLHANAASAQFSH